MKKGLIYILFHFVLIWYTGCITTWNILTKYAPLNVFLKKKTVFSHFLIKKIFSYSYTETLYVWMNRTNKFFNSNLTYIAREQQIET